ncbi:MAG: LysM peptidoglycan-binding domain-containing protein [Dehalococcoidia bacterium]|nr:LysM peptidoglycan-binding domain-containing protein [Dehalococcoidia bacterium]
MTASALHRRAEDPADGGTRSSLVQLSLLLGGGALLGLALWWLAGPPQIPSEAPDLSRLRRILTSSEVANDDVIYVATGLGWLALAHLAFSVGLRVMIGVAARVADGSAWMSAVLRLSDLVTLPAVRRIVDGALIAVILLALWTRQRSVLEVSAAPAGPIAALSREALLADTTSALSAGPSTVASANGDHASYSVAQGESLWGIAHRLYGDGTQYVVIFRTNEGRVMSTGEALTDPRLIRVGWSLDVPLPAPNLWASEEHLMYRVQPGDSLWRISESFLGDGFRWLEVWQLNQGRVMTDGRPFTDPDLIFPGWILELPVEPQADVSSSGPIEPTPTPAPSPQPVPATDPGAETEPLDEATTVVTDQPTGRGGEFTVPWPGEKAVIVSAAGLLTGGAVMLTVRALARRRADSLATEVGRSPGRTKRPSGDAGKVVLAARALMSGLADLGFDDARLVLVREAPRYQEFLLDCMPGDAEALVRARYDLGRRLACGVDGEVESPTRVRLKLSRFQRLAGLLVVGASFENPLLLVPVGATEGGVHYLNLAAAGTVLVAGSPRQTSQLASVWVSTLAATCRPDELAVISTDGLSGEAKDLGALRDEGPPTASPEAVVEELREMIVVRESGGGSGSSVAVLAILTLANATRSAKDSAETVLRHGPELRIYAVVLTEEESETVAAGAAGAKVVFGGAVDSTEAGDDSGLDDRGQHELVLSVGRHPPIGLQAVAVRADVMSPLNRPAEGLTYAGQRPAEDWQPPESEEPDEPLTESVGYEEDLEDAADGELAFGEDATADANETDDPEATASEEIIREEEPPAAAAPRFSVRCFSSFEVTTNSGGAVAWEINKAREVLAYVIARRGAGASREELAEALWPDALPSQAEHMLSNAVYYLRRALRAAGGDSSLQVLLLIGRQRYRLQPHLFRLDVDAFDAHLRRAAELDGPAALEEFERALDLYSGGFLASEQFDWAASHRQDYQRRYAAAANRAAKLAFDCREISKAVMIYKTLLERDPIDEEAARGLMRCYDRLEDVNGVRKVYKVLRESLRRELDDDKAEPLAETRALFEELGRRSASD